MKQCKDCRHWLEGEAYYAHPATADRLMSRCKKCHKSFVKANRDKKLEQYSRYERMRQQRPERREKKADYQRIHRIRNPEKTAARNKVANALRGGRIIKPDYCSACGRTKCRLEAHHTDYSRALDVLWLCFVCHREYGHSQTVINREYGGKDCEGTAK